MTRFAFFIIGTAALGLSATSASAQIYPLTNGPNGTGPNSVDSAKGFVGGNAVATERELLYHPELAGNAAAQIGVTAAPVGGDPNDGAMPIQHHARHRHRHASLAGD